MPNQHEQGPTGALLASGDLARFCFISLASCCTHQETNGGHRDARPWFGELAGVQLVGWSLAISSSAPSRRRGPPAGW